MTRTRRLAIRILQAAPFLPFDFAEPLAEALRGVRRDLTPAAIADAMGYALAPWTPPDLHGMAALLGLPRLVEIMAQGVASAVGKEALREAADRAVCDADREARLTSLPGFRQTDDGALSGTCGACGRVFVMLPRYSGYDRQTRGEHLGGDPDPHCFMEWQAGLGTAV